MPDWITHIAVAYILCTILGFKFREFNTSNTVLAMVGAVIPDFIKVGIITEYMGFGVWDFIAPIHLPIGSFIIAAMLSLLFKEKKTVFLFLSLGVVTHYGLDLLLRNVSGGIYLFYPLYWGQWQLGLVATDDFTISIIALMVAVFVYIIYRLRLRLVIRSKLEDG